MKHVKLSYGDWLRIGYSFGMEKISQDTGASPGGAPGGAGGVAGTVSGIDASLIDEDTNNDKNHLKKLNILFRRALQSRNNSVETALMDACQADGSRLFPSQLDVDLTKDPPVIRGWYGLELGPQTPKTPAPASGSPGGATPSTGT
jgi:hypothetical protein